MVSPLLRYFTFQNLYPSDQARIDELVREPLRELAEKLDKALPDSAEKTVGLRHLLDASNCFVRAALPPLEQ